MSTREYFCYTDGSCKPLVGEKRPGGWGFSVKPPTGEAIEGYGQAEDTLAKVMEYRAVAEALSVLPEGATACVLSDNRALVENLSKSLANWTSSSFVNVDPFIVEHARRIAMTLAEKRLVVRWQWLRGHNGNPGNERADALAAQGAREAKASLQATARRPGANRR